MPEQQVQLPDGTIVEFPDGMSHDDMSAAIYKNFPQYEPKRTSEESAAKRVDLVNQMTAARREGALAESAANVAGFLESQAKALANPIATVEKGIEAAATLISGSPQELIVKPSETKPLFTIPQIPQQEGKPAQVAAGVGNAVVDFVNFMATPEGFAMLGIGGLPAALRKSTLLTISTDMAAHAPEAFNAAVEAAKAGNVQDAAKATTTFLAGTSLAALAANHALTAEPGVYAKLNAADAPKTAEAMKESAEGKKDEAKPVEPVTETPKEPVAEQPAPTPAPTEIVGMGGAVPAEFELSAKTPTGIKNAVVDQERAQRGLPPAVQPTKRAFGNVWDQAMAKIDQDPAYPDRLLAELREKPRSLTDIEDATLLHRQIDLQNEYGKATRDLAQAFDDGRFDAVADQKARVASISDQLLDIYNIGKAAGTETGRGLAARKMMAYEDFSLAKMELEKRAAKDGEPLTDAERAEVVELNRKIEATQKAFDDYVAATEDRMRQMEVDRAYEHVTQQPPILDQRAKSMAERLVSALEKQADESRAYLHGKLFTISPDVLFHLSRIGAAQIARGVLEFSRWSGAMVGEFGNRIEPYLQEIFDASNKMLDERATAIVGAKESRRARRAATGEDAAAVQAELTTQIKDAFTANELKAITPLVQRLARLFVEQGVKERGQLIDAVHGVLKEVNPDITRRQAMDAISGYGDFRQLTKDEISVQLRDLKGQMQQVAKLEDIQSRKPPLKTGVERRSPSNEERELIKKVNEAKRRFGVVVTDPATQLKSALEARKTYYRNQITDLQKQIEAKEKFVKDKSASPTDPELEALKAKSNALKEEFDEIFGKPGLTDAQRLEAMQKRITELEAKVAAKDTSTKPTKVNRPLPPELEQAKQRIEALNQELKELREAANPKKTPEEVALQTLKTRLRSSIAKMEDQLKSGDFSKKQPVRPTLDAEAERLSYEAAKTKAEWHEALMKDRLSRRTIPQKLLGTVGEVLNTSRAVLTSLDLSAVLRQGGFITLGHPVRALKAFPAMFRALRSEAGQHAVNQEILGRKNYRLYLQSKLYLSEHGHKLSKMEEAYMSRWADKIPLVGASQRAYTTFLNKLRADSFDAMVNTLSRDGNVTPAEASAIANFVNVATGRGKVGLQENAATGLSTIFFAPRYVASRFQLIAGQPLYRGSARTRKLVASEYARFLTGVGVVYGLVQLAGGEVETDPRSSDFGKARFGNTRIDPMAGLLQPTVLLSRLASGETKRLSGDVVPIRGSEVPFGGDDAADVTARFLRTKLSPVVGTAVNIASGSDVTGKEVTAESAAENLLVPLALQDIYKTMVEQGVPKGTAMAILSIFGMGLQTYDQR